MLPSLPIFRTPAVKVNAQSPPNPSSPPSISTARQIILHHAARKKTSSGEYVRCAGSELLEAGEVDQAGSPDQQWLSSSARLTIVGGRSMFPNLSRSCAKQKKLQRRQPSDTDLAGWTDFSTNRWLFVNHLLRFRRRSPRDCCPFSAPKSDFFSDIRRRGISASVFFGAAGVT